MLRSDPTLPILSTPAYPRPALRVGSRHNSWKRQLWQVLAALLIAGGLLPFAILWGIHTLYSSRQLILPEIRMSGVDLGGLTREQAAGALNQAWNIQQALSLTLNGRAWKVSPIDLGLFLDPAASAELAYQAGQGPAANRLVQILRPTAHELQPVISFRPDLARAELQRRAAAWETAPQEAALSFVNGKWTATPGKPGQALDIDATLAPAAADPARIFFSGELPLVVRPLAPQVMDLSAAAARLRASLNLPLKIRVYDPILDETLDWSVTPEALAGWLTVDHPTAPDTQVRMDAGRLAAYLEQKGAALAPLRSLQPYQLPADLTSLWQQGQPLNLQARHLPTRYTVTAGDTLYQIARKVEMPYWRILQANPGLSDASLRIGQVITIPSKNDLVPLPVVANKRIVVSIAKQHMWTYENGKLRKEYVISTGIADSPTLPGVFQIQSHIENAYASNWDLWMPNFMGIYEAVPGFWNGIHGLPIMSNGQRLWGSVLGTPITYGCILTGLKEGQELYNWAQQGVVVEINP